MIAASTLLLALALTPLPTDALIVVTDPSGARVPGATVTLDQGASRELAQTSTARGEAALLGIEEGEHRVSVSLPGFETWEKTVKIRAGQKPIEVKLRMARVAESVLVAPDNREAGSGGYRTTLTEADLANLPDDPDQLEAALRAMAGPQASMRVNGFSGGRLPPKSQIRQIRFVMNPYAAEFHESQPVFIDIQTKPGLGQWSRTARFGLRDESFNSLSPLARARVPDSYQRFGLDLSGPLIKNKTSLSISAEGRLTDTARIVRATNTAGNLSDLADSSTDRLDLSARLEHGWGKTHTLRAELETLSRNEAGLGIGGLELKERGYTQDRREKTVRITDNGVIFGHVASELRFSAKFDSLDTTSASASPAVRVLGSFTSGGAGFVGGRSGRDLELSSNFDVSAGKKHAMRFGFQLRDQRISSTEQQNAAGTFTFDDLAAYAAQRPSQFTQRTGDPHLRYGMQQAGLYFQDEARISKRLTLGAGVRIESQSEVSGLMNLGPRASATYSLDSKTTLRGGSGLFFNWYGAETYEQTLRLDGVRETEAIVTNPNWPDPFSALASRTLQRSTRLFASALAMPRVWRSSAGIERGLGGRLRATLDYTYLRGSRELRSRNRSTSGSSLSLREIESSARSTRHIVDARLNLRPSPEAKGGFFVGYLWQSSRDEADGPLSLPARENDLAAEWGRSANDARHRVFGLVNLNPTKQISLGAILFASSSLPFNVLSGRDENGDAVFNDRPTGVKRNTGIGPDRITLDVRAGWARSFGGARAPRPGEGMRVIRIGDGEGVPDTSASGTPQRYRVSVFLQAFNVLNRTNPTAVGTVLGSPLFGMPILTEPGRRLELGATFSF